MPTNDVKLDVEDIIKSAQLSMQEQARALLSLAETLDNQFVKAVDGILNTKGRLVISGMGKSGHIGKKIAASLASTGTRAFFMHPGEAFHGDLGMVAPEDVVLLISNSGESDEVLKLIPALKRFGNKIVGMHGNPESTLGQNSDINLIVRVDREICPHNLAPTTSTIAAMAMGDALTVALMNQRNFMPEDFAKYHPGGALGRRLLCTVKDTMKSDADELPIVDKSDLLKESLLIMTRLRTGYVLVVDNSKKLIGVLTDGDIRRSIMNSISNLEYSVENVMATNPVSVSIDTKIQVAEDLMKSKKIKFLVVVDEDKKVLGVLDYYGI